MEAAPTLTASRSVLDFVSAGIVTGDPSMITSVASDATFQSVDDDTGVLHRLVKLEFDDWVDMGRPSQITITIEPGDHLNDGGS